MRTSHALAVIALTHCWRVMMAWHRVRQRRPGPGSRAAQASISRACTAPRAPPACRTFRVHGDVLFRGSTPLATSGSSVAMAMMLQGLLVASTTCGVSGLEPGLFLALEGVTILNWRLA